MKLFQIEQMQKTQYDFVLVPSNSGLQNLQPSPFQSLGIPYSEADRYSCTPQGMDRKLQILKYRGEDIPPLLDFFMEQGDPAIGFTGDDLFDEYRYANPETALAIVDTVDWIIPTGEGQKFSRPTFCLIAEEGKTLDDLRNPNLVVNSKYQKTAELFVQQLNLDYGLKPRSIRYVSGKLENEIPERADAGLEIVVSGGTLEYLDRARTLPRDPKLDMVRVLRQSDISVITSWQRGKNDPLRQQYEELLERGGKSTGSYSSELMRDANALVKKLGEESAELVAAYSVGAGKGSPGEILEEAQQVFWVVQMMLATENVSWETLLDHVRRGK